MSAPDPTADQVRSGDRRALARAITLVESRRAEDRTRARALLDELHEGAGSGKALRVGVSGVPGAGKSTFIDSLGARLAERGERIAVLAVDPSSSRSGGSILGDKTRMEKLATHPGAFVRPSPGGTETGGVGRRTRESILLCEAAGHDVVFVETIGVGQAETAVADMVDTFVLLQLPRTGDDLQGIKRGIMELVDVLVIHKADGDNVAAAEQAQKELRVALALVPPTSPGWTVPLPLASSRTGAGLEDVWDAIRAHRAHLDRDGGLASKRSAQNLRWFETAIQQGLRDALEADVDVARALPDLRDRVASGSIQPIAAAEELLRQLLG